VGILTFPALQRLWQERAETLGLQLTQQLRRKIKLFLRALDVAGAIGLKRRVDRLLDLIGVPRQRDEQRGRENDHCSFHSFPLFSGPRRSSLTTDGRAGRRQPPASLP